MPVKAKANKPTAEAEHLPLFETTRKVVLAGIGAVALAQDELEEFVTRLIERGEIAEREGKSLIQEAKERRNKRMEKVEGEITKKIEEILRRIDLPTKSEIDVLNDKIAALSRKIDELKKSD